MTTDHRNSPVLSEIGVIEFNGGVRISIESAQITVSAHVKWKYGKESTKVL